jgi:hypothetical protein
MRRWSRKASSRARIETQTRCDEKGRRQSPPAFSSRSHHTLGWKTQRGRGRSGGRAASGRGRKRSPGPIGGGTARSGLPQSGQCSRPALGPERWARSQCPRAAHCGLMHCTVQPGRYCMLIPSEAAHPVSGDPQGSRNCEDGGILLPSTCGVK